MAWVPTTCQVTIDHPPGQRPRCSATIVVGDAELGQTARLSLRLAADVNKAGGQSASREIAATSVRLDSEIVNVSLDVPHDARRYAGRNLHVDLEARLSTRSGEHAASVICTARAEPLGSPAIMDLPDYFDVRRNLLTLSWQFRLMIALILIVGFLGVIGAVGLGAHFQSVRQSATTIRSSENSGYLQPRRLLRRRDNPIVIGIFVAVVVAVAAFFAARRAMTAYATLRPAGRPTGPGGRVPVAMMFAGTTRVDLANVTLRIVAANVETYQVRGHKRPYTESKISGAALLYEQHLPLLRRGESIPQAFGGEVCLDAAYLMLLPPMHITRTTGVRLVIEAQLIHDDLLDRKCRIDAEGWFDPTRFD